jgi:hypothetical protein
MFRFPLASSCDIRQPNKKGTGTSRQRFLSSLHGLGSEPVSVLLGILIQGLIAVCMSQSAFGDELAAAGIRVLRDPISGQIDIIDGSRPVLRYNYQMVQPPAGLLDRVAAANRTYARPRCDYIHPLFGLDGQRLTDDWQKDHPHHRGIYWAWPEVDFRGQRGDLHALQHVFARPTGKIELRNNANWAEIEAENVWKWEDLTPIVLETAVIRARRGDEHGRFIDLNLTFRAIQDDVSLARRDTSHYGGLNIRLAPIQGIAILTHNDVPSVQPRTSWGVGSGIWDGNDHAASLIVFQHPNNSEYPGQWIEYPTLPWFQPTFPTAGNRYILKKGAPLELQFRLWIRRGEKPAAELLGRQWKAYVDASNR